ncbi:ribosomal protein S18-alanine N-acetyltransferase [Gallaecimonas sp. GXIMD4217]|uniref:ribosomal protein S18-alanine N-acetyltransferase n=1 Tax=Gallaecimonas sp. GXIMD4217 TaxID=3131927 RepID=UPI00311AC665
MISTATESDLPRLLEVELTCHPFPWSEGQLASCLGPGYRVRMFEEQGQLLGFCISQRILDESTLFNICVLPSQRGRGLGQLLLNDLIADCKGQGDQALFLEVRASNTAAIALYEKVGFELLDRRKDYYRSGREREDALVMRLAFEQV